MPGYSTWLAAMLAVVCGVAASAHAASLDTATAVYQTVAQERVFDGVLEAVHRSTVSAQTTGAITEINYDVNDFVPKGNVILRIEDTEQRAGLGRAKAGLQEAQARYTEASDEYRRVQDVFNKKLVAESELDRATAARNAAEARLEAAKAQLAQAQQQLVYTVVAAPYAGYVTQRHVELGESVAPGQPLMTGFSLESLRAVVNVPQAFAAAVRTHNQARVIVPPTQRSIDAVNITAFPYADQQTHAFTVRVRLPDGESALFPGMFVKVAFVTGQTQRLLVPGSAIVQRSELTAVYVVTGDERVRFRQIRSGRSYDGQVEVLAGLEAGERVAVDPIAAAISLKQQE